MRLFTTTLRSHRRITLVIVIMVAGMIALGAAWLTFDGLRIRVNRVLESVGALPPSLPLYITTNAPPDRPTARRLLVAALHDALAQEDYVLAAKLNAIFSQEALLRAARNDQAWKTLRTPDSGLIPWADSPWYREWNPRALAGNLFSHLLIADHYLDSSGQRLWDQTMTSERELCGPLPCFIAIDSLTIVEQDLNSRLMSATEYARDGLLSITERFGPGLWFDRLIEMTDAVLDNAIIETDSGLIISDGTEVNGAQLQVLVRLYWATQDERYLEMSERIAEAYLFDVLPKNGGLPTDYWDFANQQPLTEDVRFRPEWENVSGVYPFRLADHGGEIIGGLAELYFLERVLDRPQADQYEEPLQAFFDTLIASGRNADGLWYRSIVPETGEPFNDQINDNWGYNLAGLHTFDLANGSDRYHTAIEDMMRAVTTQLSANWEATELDGYADSIESMLYLLPWFDIPEAHYWVDHEIEVMFLKQRENGFVESWFLDGNFVRTALLYAQYKTQGIMPDPWSEKLRVGAAYDQRHDQLYVYVAGETDWEGRLRFDTPRHRQIWNLPIEYPRVNGLPEWYTVEADKTYVITNVLSGEVTSYSGQALADGLPVSLNSAQNSLLLIVSAEEA